MGRPMGARSPQEPTRKPPAPVFPRARPFEENVAMVEGEQRQVSVGTKVATVSPTKKVSPAPRPSGSGALLLAANTRRLGRRLELELEKGPHGLGFSITTRDNPAGGDGPVYIKNILPKGAAVEDGRLRPGDRLLQVNGEEMTGKSQADAVAVLRSAPLGSRVSIVVSRQEDGGGSGGTSPRLPRQLVPAEEAGTTPEVPAANTARPTAAQEHSEKTDEDALLYPWKHKEILTFDIPVHDTEKAGLGVSVKGKTTTGHSHNSHINHSNHNSSNNSSGGNSSGGSGSVDLGIFVKSVLHGGAASRDGRLQTNDQLLNVNSISLLGQSNADAMETLRRAMLHTEGPVPGVITLTVARRSGHSPSSGHGLTNGTNTPSKRSDGGVELGKGDGDGLTPDHSGASENSDNTVIFLPYSHPQREDSRDSSIASIQSVGSRGELKHVPVDILSTRNPVLDRLTGQVASSHALRNESYYRATNETWNTTVLLSGSAGDTLSSPTVNQTPGELVLIEEELLPPPPPCSLQERTGTEKPNVPRWNDRASEPRVPSEPGSEVPVTDATYASQLSLEEAAACFSRDAFGRQSMSEKRHAALDAKNTDTYQRNKRLREERERQRQLQQEQQQLNERSREGRNAGEAKMNQDLMVRANSIESIISLTRSQADSERSAARALEFGPSLGMKKSSSLESLQTLVQELQMQEEVGYRGGSGSSRAARARGCNESFRAAVDRSYEAPLSELRSRLEMETLAEEDAAGPDGGGGAGGGVGGGGGGGGVGGGGGGRLGPGDPLAVPLAFAVRGGPRQSSLNAALDAKHKGGKKKPGLLKGIGSMFRFGKHRKPLEEAGAGPGPPEGPDLRHAESAAAERAAARRAAEEEQQRIQEQYRRLQQQQQQQQQQQRQRQTESGGSVSGSVGGSVPAAVHPPHPQLPQHPHHLRDGSSSSSSGGGGGGGGPGAPPQSRVERIHELRAQHQRRHAERRGRYPQDAREERYEEVIRQHLEEPETPPIASTGYDLYGEMGRPGSRAGISDPARFSHYVNYEEIQQHLSKHREHLSEVQIMQMREQVQRQRYKVEEESRRQQHYHSQRRETRELHRPVSNFYEYESIQSAARPVHQWSNTVAAADSNSNSLPRHVPLEWAHKNNNNNNNGGPAYSNHQKLYQTAQSAGSSNFRLAAANKREAPLPMVHNIRGNTKNTNVPSRPQGPFVTQVLIGEQLPAPGSKV